MPTSRGILAASAGSRSTLHLMLGMAWLAACSSHDVVSPPPPSITLAPTTGWAGSAVTVYSEAFRTQGTGVVLHFGAASTALTRVDDTTLTGLIPPTTAAGPVTPSIEVGGDTVSLGSITVFGSDGVQDLQLAPITDPYVWRTAGHAVLIAATVSCLSQCQYGLSLFDLDARTVLTNDGLWHGCPHGPGSSYLDSVVVVCDSSGVLETWRLFPSPSRIASYPGVQGDWSAMQLSPSQWLIGHKSWISTPSLSVSTDQAEVAYMSPRHDRATVRSINTHGGACFGCQIIPGIPVFAVPSGDLAYVVSQLTASEAVDFSADGELLVMGGGIGARAASSDSDRVVLLRASTGQVLADTILVGRGVFAISIDPYRPLVYVGMVTSGRPTILVLDRTTFRTIGEMQAGASNSCCGVGVIAVSSQGAVYMYADPPAGVRPTRVWRFTVPPAATLRKH